VNEYEQTLLMLRGTVASLPKETQDKIQGAYDRIRAMEAESDQGVVILAVALIGAEEAAK